MSLPSPPVRLEGHCSAIFNNTLYAYQWNAFQALPLEDGGTWSQLPMGVAVNGSKCVLGTSDDQDALFVVGGVSSSSSQEFPGLQRFLFGDKKWFSTQAGQSVTQNRQMHGAAFLNSTSSILVYSGFQDNSFTKSSQTFTLSTKAPYTMKSFPAAAPPVMNPLTLPWNASHVAMIGGDPSNKAVWVFGEETGWQPINVQLPDSVQDMTKVQAAILQGEGGSKAIELFDAGKSPNEITPIRVQPPNGQPPPSKAEIIRPSTGNRRPTRRRFRREVDLSALPPYDSTLAPKEERSGYSIAQSPSGLVVISGGNAQGSDDPFCIFNQTGNSWVDSKALLGVSDDSQSSRSGSAPTSPTSVSAPASGSESPASSSSSSSSAPSGPAAVSATSTATPPPTTSESGDNSKTILGAVLGGVFGFAALVILFLLAFRYYRTRKLNRLAAAELAREGKPETANGDGGASGIGGGFLATRHSPKSSAESGSGTPGKRGIFNKSNESISHKLISTPRLISDSSSPENLTTFNDNLANLGNPTTITAPRTQGRADEGWSQYFSNNTSSGNDLARSGPGGLARINSTSAQTQYTQSDYNSSDSHDPSIYAHESDEVAPLSVRGSRICQAALPPSQPLPPLPQLRQQSSTATSSSLWPGLAVSDSVNEEPEAFLDPASSSSGMGQQSWDPVGSSSGSSWDRRPASSVYADSVMFPHPGKRMQIPDFPPYRAATRRG